ncbi:MULTISPECIES: enoyl-CoA hydratase [Nocardiaceae]|jgi:enoyl-CoA hydratase|uniref:enoyl-CoA hydratase n=1 Tax=Nocardiaceae TaxID=85025 RepID=UPI00056B6997|nr:MULTISPECIES: enoyl-CoA hydratase [Rhodococcus]OZF05449.1 enoyl-CoA hydratase [Rhodococcus sp. 15-1189-1-1a]OZF20232.1 enoyl-CoA hydratase [Rhodococcus sp. 14-2686-1-2]OZF56351.1 enoyl-CoA hydratase [Rhodococcus sp. 14-2470-1b]
MIGQTRDGDVVTLELQRPERRNALNTQLCVALREGIEKAVADDARVIVITGQGTSFCAGADLDGDDFAKAFPEALESLLRAVDGAPVPVIAAINGPAVGAGTQLAIASDLRVVADGAFFEIPSTRLGIAVNNWTIKRLASLAGGSVARTILMGGERLDADRAYTSGLANKRGDLAVAMEWASAITELAPLALKHLKLVFNDDGTHDEPTREQWDAFGAAWTSEDMKEARRARTEKRKPKFQGR